MTPPRFEIESFWTAFSNVTNFWHPYGNTMIHVEGGMIDGMDDGTVTGIFAVACLLWSCS